MYKKKYKTRLVSQEKQKLLFFHFVTSPFKSMYFEISCKNSCRKTIEATMMKKHQMKAN